MYPCINQIWRKSVKCVNAIVNKGEIHENRWHQSLKPEVTM